MDPEAFDCRDDSLKCRPWEETALYELHVGTFGPEGTFDGVMKRLGHLANLGPEPLGGFEQAVGELPRESC